MNSFHCPFCNSDIPVTKDTHAVRVPSFERDTGCFFVGDKLIVNESCINIDFFRCPKCSKYSIFASEKGPYSKGLNVPIIPNSLAKQYPDYIPQVIKSDYEEAYAILHLSSKASATLSRRCLQGMIRDFWGISKSRLIDEVKELQHIVPAAQWKAIDSLRKLGNIGAHMEKDINTIVDVEPYEAEKLLKLIELLIDKWYIARHDEEELLSEITSIANSKDL